jgi:hypothetical protein
VFDSFISYAQNFMSFIIIDTAINKNIYLLVQLPDKTSKFMGNQCKDKQ